MEIIKILILFGSFHGFLLSIALINRGISRSDISNIWFGAVIIFLSFYLLEHLAVLNGFITLHPNLMFITYPSLFFIGPLIYIYSRSALKRTLSIKKSGILLIPGCIIYLMFLPFYIANSDTVANSCLITELANFDFLLYFIKPSVFILFTLVFLLSVFVHITKGNSISTYQANLNIRFKWVKKLIFGLIVFLSISFLYHLVLWINPSFDIAFASSIQFVILAILIHSIGYISILEPGTISDVKPIRKGEKYETSSINKTMSRLILKDIEMLMRDQKVFLHHDINIQRIADELQTSRHRISQVINQETGLSVLDFINKFRVEEAVKLMSNKNKDVKIRHLALDVGFNNRVSFYRAFKKFTGVSPTDFVSSPQISVTSDQM